LAHDAVNMTGYIIQVKGFADSARGTAAMDQKSSMDRAQAVIAYLAEKCSVSVRHIVAPGAMARLIPWQSN
jgi:outer membrane protein OmpA-like peptidoglycan-associated protein